jgi:hypothetical protein
MAGLGWKLGFAGVWVGWAGCCALLEAGLGSAVGWAMVCAGLGPGLVCAVVWARG